MVTYAVNCSRPAGMKSPPTEQFSPENSVTIPTSPLDSAGSVGGSKVSQLCLKSVSISNKFRSSFVGHSFAIVICFSITYDPKKGHIKFACRQSLCLNFVFIFKLYCQTSLQSAETPSSWSTFIYSMFKCDIDYLLGIYILYNRWHS